MAGERNPIQIYHIERTLKREQNLKIPNEWNVKQGRPKTDRVIMIRRKIDGVTEFLALGKMSYNGILQMLWEGVVALWVGVSAVYNGCAHSG